MLTACGQPVGTEPVLPTALPEKPAQESPVLLPEVILEPEPEVQPTVDPASVLLPDLELFLRSSPFEGKPIEYVYGAKMLQFVYLPYGALEAVSQEVRDLLAQPQYQLELTEEKTSDYYGTTVYSYYYAYMGSSGVNVVPNKYDDTSYADVILAIRPEPAENWFHVCLFYGSSFELEDPGVRTSRNLDPQSDGEELTEEPVPGTESENEGDFWEKCSSCHGSGRCSRCGGDDTVKEYQAGLGWVDQNCTSCSGGRCRWCGGSGKA